MDLSQFGVQETIPENLLLKMTIFGEPGSGKSWLSATSHNDPRMGPALILSCEAGMEGIATMENPPPHKEVANYQELMTYFWKVAEWQKKGEWPFRTLILDTYSELYNNTLLENYKKRTGMKEGDGKSIGKYEWDDYGKTANNMRDAIDKLRKLDCHLIITCHSKIDKNEKTGRETITIATSGASAEPITRLMDVVGLLEWGPKPKATEKDAEPEETRIFRTKGSARYLAKARGRAARIGSLVNPTMTDILDVMEGKE